MCVVGGSTFRGENFNFAAADAAKPSGKGFRLSALCCVRTEGFEPAVGLGANLPVAPLRAVSGVEDLGGGEGVAMSVLRLQGDSLLRLGLIKGFGVQLLARAWGIGMESE